MAAPPRMQEPTSSGALVLFALGGAARVTLCALPRDSVRALLPLPRLDTPPGLPPPLAGFLNLGGTAVPVVELAPLLGLPPGEPHPYRHLVLLDRPSGPPIALLVDRVADVLPPGQPVRPAEAGLSVAEVVTGAVDAGGDTVHLLDPARLLLTQEAAVLDALARQAQERLSRWEAPEAAWPAPHE